MAARRSPNGPHVLTPASGPCAVSVALGCGRHQAEGHPHGGPSALATPAPPTKREGGRGDILIQAGIDSISVTPDSSLTVEQNVAAAERERAENGDETP
ncbi:hypothetical protein Airi02_068280 [Actinoallomurus iriomotensis]|uniref:Uncharacterized protein n=1 Tax=Actinoallomurus iriomotensis TaxID=478107 RepID=A0A9W6W2Y0_9ACTN|nr:hypothetical protein Airi02_068280 [Actinoallomurus iriomotensis]